MKVEKRHVKKGKRSFKPLNIQERGKIKKILIIQRDYLGDFILTTPLIKEIKEFFPCAKLYCIGRTAANELYNHNPYLSSFITFDGFSGPSLDLLKTPRYYVDFVKLIFKVRKMNFDLVINVTREFAFKFAFLAFMTSAKYRISLKTRNKMFQIFKVYGFGFLHTVDVPINRNRYNSDYYLDTIRVLGHRPGKIDFYLFINKNDEKFVKYFFKEKSIGSDDIICIVHPFSNYEKKQWGINNYKKIISNIVEDEQIRVFVIGAQNEKKEIDKILTDIKSKNLYSFAGMPWGKLKALSKYGDIFIGSDSGPMHIAASFGLRTVVIMAGNSNHYAPKGIKHKVIIPNLTCYPCYDFLDYTRPQKFHSCGIDCLKTIDSADVLSAVREQIDLIKNEKNKK